MNTIPDLRKQAKALAPILQVGKKGITDELVLELRKLLKRHQLVKVKLLRSFLGSTSREEAVALLSGKADAAVIDQSGFCVTFYQRKIYKDTSPEG
ncbi:MAG: YhbY family RNA-binding protein [Nanoarchaeota archaeon]